MYRTVTRTLGAALVLFWGVTLVGCDDDISSIQDVDIQPDLEISQSSVTFVDGQTPPPTFEVTYQGVDDHPEASASGDLEVTKEEEEGTAENGSQVWSLNYTTSLEANSVGEQVSIEASGEGNTFNESISVQVNNPISVSDTVVSELAAVADYEDNLRDRSAEGGTSIDVVEDTYSENSTGVHSLQVNGSSSGSFTIERQANLPNLDIFSFLVKPNPNTDFDLTITFEEEADGNTRTEEITVSVPSGNEWRKFSIAAGQLFGNFNPVAERAGGNGPLTSVTFSADSDVTYHVDQLGYGTSQNVLVEIDDFERTTGAYGPPFCPPTFTFSENVAEISDGPTSRSIAGTGCFGYNYNEDFGAVSLLRLDATNDGVVSLRIGEVSTTFKLFVFLETEEGAGGYTFDNGIEVVVEPGSEWRRITVPFADLGGADVDPSALKDPGLTNVGFESRRLDDDDSDTPIEFLIDEIKLFGAAQ